MKGQLRELLTRYGPLGILWFDGEWEKPWTHERGVDLYNYVRSFQPNIIVNNRVGKGRSGMQGMDKGQSVGDYGTPEQEIPPTGFGPSVAWESCMTMNNHWGYNKSDQHWKSTQILVRNLIDCASKGGNYLLNIGPTSEGSFPEASVERLAAIGQWMKANHEAIYGTQAGPFKRLTFGRCTSRATKSDSTLYLHVFSWPDNGRLLVPGLKSKITKAYLLADKKKKALATTFSAEGVSISVPSAAPDPVSSTIVVKLKGAPEIQEKGLTQNPDGSLTLLASDAKLHGDQIRFETGERRECLGFWTNPEDWAQWEFTVTRPGKFRATAKAASVGDSSFTALVGETRLAGQVRSTGDSGNFKTVDLGSVELSKGGCMMVSVRPVKDGWNPVNLRSIQLKPGE